MIMSLRPVLAVFLLLALTSCRENVLGPLDNTVYVLRSVDGASLPATVPGAFGGLAWVVTADTIWFESGSSWRRHSVQHREAGVGGEPVDFETSGTVVREPDGLLVLAFECPDGDCLAPDRLVQTETGLEMHGTYLHDGTRLLFQPI
jgi:hypothetical protein